MSALPSLSTDTSTCLLYGYAHVDRETKARRRRQAFIPVARVPRVFDEIISDDEISAPQGDDYTSGHMESRTFFGA